MKIGDLVKYPRDELSFPENPDCFGMGMIIEKQNHDRYKWNCGMVLVHWSRVPHGYAQQDWAVPTDLELVSETR